jgi:hypothetical protein
MNYALCLFWAGCMLVRCNSNVGSTCLCMGFCEHYCKFWITSLVFCSKFLSLIVGVEMHRIYVSWHILCWLQIKCLDKESVNLLSIPFFLKDNNVGHSIVKAAKDQCRWSVC